MFDLSSLLSTTAVPRREGRRGGPFIVALGRMPNGKVMGRLGSDSNFAAGNAEFFDADPRCLIQLRPLLSSDVDTSGMGRRSNAILWGRDDTLENTELVAYVDVPSRWLRNDRAGIMRAVEFVERRMCTRTGPMFRRIAGRTRWPNVGTGC